MRGANQQQHAFRPMGHLQLYDVRIDLVIAVFEPDVENNGQLSNRLEEDLELLANLNI